MAHVLLKLTDEVALPEIMPGQFVELRVTDSPSTYLRRPISVNNVDYERNELWLLVHVVGAGTAAMSRLKVGDRISCLFPLGNGYSPAEAGQQLLLVGGGVGTAPLIYNGLCARARGAEVSFLLGAKKGGDILQLELFKTIGNVYVTTEDGSAGEPGFVTNHSILKSKRFDLIQVCGPKPMMQAVARYAKAEGIACEVSLENMMACGLGACLCCVEKTREGNLCVCKEGPVFNIERLNWE